MKQFQKKMMKLVGPVIGLSLFIGTLYGLLILFEKHEVKKVTKASEGKKKYLTDISNQATAKKRYRFVGIESNSEINIKLTYDEKVIYDQNYRTNDFLMRVPLAHAEKRKFHAIFGGCSYTWGEGLKPEETFPWIFQESFKSVNAYNLGLPGGGLSFLLRYNDLFDLKQAVKEQDGIFVFNFYHDHMNRFFARYGYLAWALEQYPLYEVEKNRPVYKGELKDQPIYKKFMLYRKSGIEKAAINTEDIHEFSDKEIKDFAISVRELSRLYKKKFPKGTFYFALHPKDRFPYEERLKWQLMKLKINVLDPMEDFHSMLEKENKTISDMELSVHDNHPNAALNRYYGDWLARAIKKAGQNLK